jgi:4-hydroxy-2-oxoheptanedioate aldolase
MRVNTAKQRMLEGKPAVGASAGMGSTLSVELLAQAGFDFILVDNQHGAWDDKETMAAFRSVCAGGAGTAVPMARVRQNDFGAIGRLLDAGALGIVVPMVHTVEQARAAVLATRFPPQGGRSSGPFGTGFLGPDYLKWANGAIFLAIQIESRQAVTNAEAILGVDGIDGCWVGPADLALSMGVDLTTPEGAAEHRAAILRVLEACRKTGKVPGIASGPNAREWLELGFRFVTAGGDAVYVIEGARRTLQALQDLR